MNATADEEAAHRGLNVARDALLAAADGEAHGALLVINAAPHGELAWAAAYLVSLVGESMSLLAGGDSDKARRYLLAGLDGIHEDGVVLTAELIIGGARRQEGGLM